MVFATEEERAKALDELNKEEMPSGANSEKWAEEIEKKQDEILNAEIGESASSEEKPPGEMQPDEKKDSVDDFIDFSAMGKIKRDELPEDLRKYANPTEMIHQAAGARRYANKIEEEKQAWGREKAELARQIEELREAAKEKTELEKRIQEFQSKKPEELKISSSYLEDLTKIGDEDVIEAGIVKKAISGMANEFKTTKQIIEELKKANSNHRATIENLTNRLDGYITTSEEERKREQEKAENDKMIQDLLSLQSDKHPELKTSIDFLDVDKAVSRFVERVYGEEPKWNIRNKIINAYIQKDPEIMKMCSDMTISPADYNITDNDMKAYALLTNVYHRKNGNRINKNGELEEFTDVLGRKVVLPDHETAYLNMLDELGIRDKQAQKREVEAELRGQSSLAAALSNRDLGPLGKDGSGSPDGAGAPVEKDAALEIVGAKPGRRTVEQSEMAKLIMANDRRGWEMFDQLNRAYIALGLPAEQPEPEWPGRDTHK